MKTARNFTYNQATGIQLSDIIGQKMYFESGEKIIRYEKCEIT